MKKIIIAVILIIIAGVCFCFGKKLSSEKQSACSGKKYFDGYPSQ